jgi:hypothetical protein
VRQPASQNRTERSGPLEDSASAGGASGDIMKADFVSEIVLLSSGTVMVVALVIVTVRAAFT